MFKGSLVISLSLSPFLYEYRKVLSRQCALLTPIKRFKIKFCLDKQSFTGALLKFYFYFIGDLSIAFDTINHEQLIAKLHIYGFSTDVLEILLSNLQDRWQRVKINTQGSVFGSI